MFLELDWVILDQKMLRINSCAASLPACKIVLTLKQKWKCGNRSCNYVRCEYNKNITTTMYTTGWIDLSL